MGKANGNDVSKKAKCHVDERIEGRERQCPAFGIQFWTPP